MRVATTLSALLALAAPSMAAFDLQITEIWPGNEPGSNLTNDWFEVTNLGDMPFVFGTDGALFFDDDSQDAGTADPITGISEIAAGESVVFLDVSAPEEPGDPSIADQVTEFTDLWGAVVALPQVATYSGSGLSQGGDAVTLFLTDGAAPTGLLDIIDFEVYPDADFNGGQSYDVTLGAFSTGVVTAGVNDAGQPAIGTPGSVVPEPTAALLAALAATGLGAARRR